MLSTILAETAFTLPEVAQLGDQLSFTWPDDGSEREDASKEKLNVLCYAICHATWVRSWLNLEDFRKLDTIFKSAKFALERNSITDDEDKAIIAVSPGVQSGLRERVATFLTFKDEPDFYNRFPFELFYEMFVEGVLDWLIRSKRANYELRGCIWCGRWFEPTIARRGRFCGFQCRKRFNNARVSADTSVRTFKCYACDDARPLEEFSGLCLLTDAQCMITHVTEHMDDASMRYLCIRHVLETAPRWKRYIEPFITESLKETL